jgi:hypothetical protein
MVFLSLGFIAPAAAQGAVKQHDAVKTATAKTEDYVIPLALSGLYATALSYRFESFCNFLANNHNNELQEPSERIRMLSWAAFGATLCSVSYLLISHMDELEKEKIA